MQMDIYAILHTLSDLQAQHARSSIATNFSGASQHQLLNHHHTYEHRQISSDP